MLVLKKDIIPGMVVWAKKVPFYDDPSLVKDSDSSLYAVVYRNDEALLACPLVNQYAKCDAVTYLSPSEYPLRYTSKIKELIYKVPNETVIGNHNFALAQNKYEYFIRRLYQKILSNRAEGVTEYNNLFTDYYFDTHRPSIDSIIVYPRANENGRFRKYYVVDEDDSSYKLKEIIGSKNDGYTFLDAPIVDMPKDRKYYSVYMDSKVHKEMIKSLFPNRNI